MSTHDPLANLRNPVQGTQEDPPHLPLANPRRIMLTEDEKYNFLVKQLLDIRLEAQRQSRMAFDYAHPVDEYEVIGVNASTLDLGLPIRTQYDYDERYESITYSLPLGTTAATLQIGTDRTFQLYSGPAITVQQPIVLENQGIIASSGDERYLFITGAGTTNGYINLAGWAMNRGIDR